MTKPNAGNKNTEPLCVVGIGSSAGGLEALSELLKHLSPQSGMAYVIVSHLHPEHESMMGQLLSKVTQIPIAEVTDGVNIKPNNIYVIAPNCEVSITDGALHQIKRGAEHGRMLIDYFFRSLADVKGDQAVGIVLSGNGSDGAAGLAEIKAAGGITFAQEPASAKFDSMPRAAITSGSVDFVLAPQDIALELSQLSDHSASFTPPDEGEPPQVATDYQQILQILRNTAGDFSHYRQTTIRRRIQRRMLLSRVENLPAYVKYLRQNPQEATALQQDCLIKVTSFFRDPEVFETLKKTVFPALIKPDRPPDAPLRIWVPACSTGEEVYSLAMSLLDYLGDDIPTIPIQIFATDVSAEAIEKARVGIYLANITDNVSADRLRRYFLKSDQHYQISKNVRDMCVFATHDLTKDAPFSHMDLISCRNMLIYLEPDLQKRVIFTFHYALKPTGFLVLGSSETVGTARDGYHLEDRRHKIYSKRQATARMMMDFRSAPFIARADLRPKVEATLMNTRSLQQEADQLLLTRFAPPGVIINKRLEIVQFRGRTGQFLEAPAGEVTLDVVKMARPGLQMELRAALQKCIAENVIVRKEGVTVKTNGHNITINLEAAPIKSAGSVEPHYLVIFENTVRSKAAPPAKAKKAAAAASDGSEIANLRTELEATRQYLQTTTEQYEATHEELQTANEEILSSNEELQSINEELETAKEELQCTNEELTTVNEELQNRNEDLTILNSDLTNLLGNVNVPMVMVGNDLSIRRFTPMAAKLLNVISTDISRPITDMKLNIDAGDLEQTLRRVIDTMETAEQEVKDRSGHWYAMRIRPYKTIDNRIDGALITLTDIHEMKTDIQRLEQIGSLESALNNTTNPVMILDNDLTVRHANKAFLKNFKVQADEIEGKPLFELTNLEHDTPAIRSLVESTLGNSRLTPNFETSFAVANFGGKKMLLCARAIGEIDENVSALILTITEVPKG